MCSRIANPAVGLNLDSSAYWEAAEERQAIENTGKPPRCPRTDGRSDLLVCLDCYNERKALEAEQRRWERTEESSKDDAHEDAKFEKKTLRPSKLDGPPGERADSDAELAEALRLSMLDVPPEDAELAEALRLSKLDVPPQETSDFHAELEQALPLPKLDVPPEERSDSDEKPEALHPAGFALRLSELEAQRKANEDPEALRQPRWEADDWVLIDEEPRSPRLLRRHGSERSSAEHIPSASDSK